MREGSNSMTVCQPMVMMLVLPFEAELTSTIGPGSRKRRTWETGRSFLGMTFMGLSEEQWEEDQLHALFAAPFLQAFIVQLRGVQRAWAAATRGPPRDPCELEPRLASSGACNAQGIDVI